MHDHQRLKTKIEEYQKDNVVKNVIEKPSAMRMFTYKIRQMETSKVIGTVVLIIAICMLVY